MAGLRFALAILGAGAALQVVVGQTMMMVPAPMIIRHTNHPHQMGQLIQPVHITEEYPSPKEPIDEARLHQRLKELEVSQQSLRQKQMELDDKIETLHGEALRCEKEIAEDQQEINRLEELERLQYMEQVRLERLLERQRMAEYQEKINQERLARQRAIEEMNREEERQRNVSRKEPYDETPQNGNYETRMEEETGETYKHKLDESPGNEPGNDAIHTKDLPGRARKNERSHSTALLRPKPLAEQETLHNLQPNMAPRTEHVIEKKAVHHEPTLGLRKTQSFKAASEPLKRSFKVDSEPKDVQLPVSISALKKSDSDSTLGLHDPWNSTAPKP